ncbi:hypothetical protein FE810_08335 [Thalassotalea litorea]|uniref:Uncharacterized protein n=1 Tax=Thalassotalea litorea TaxID=2020715 RepID=A0A5R9IJ23_9GAMM|nr:hypothetical protein [Thalassotalea litorea]TLU65292.1 hypothetical protein FE810_08335 [Thalassotalea litorea]
MFLTRLKNYLLNKNFGSFLIEFCILILGVYLSLQANEWQNNRANRALEVQYLDRLQNDFRKSSEGLEESIQRIELSLEKISFGLSILTKETRNEEDYHKVFEALQSSSITGSFSVYLGTFEELKDTGYMRLIESRELRENLGNVWQKKVSISQITNIRNLLRSDAFPVMAKYIKPLEGNRITFDSELVEQDPRELYVAMSIILSNLKYDLEDSKELHETINNSLVVISNEIDAKS